MRIHLQSLHGVVPTVWVSSEGDVMSDFGGMFMAMSKDEARAFAAGLTEAAGEAKPFVALVEPVERHTILRGNEDLVPAQSAIYGTAA